MAFELWFVPAGQLEPTWWSGYETFADLLAALVERKALDQLLVGWGKSM